MPVIVGIAVALILLVLVVIFLAIRSARDKKEHETTVQALSARIVGLQDSLHSKEADQSRIERDAQWYRHLFDITNDMILVLEINEDGMPGTFLEVNSVACERLKYTREQLLSLSLGDIAPQNATVTVGYSRPDLASLPDDYIQKRERKIATQAIRTLVQKILSEGHVQFETEFRDHSGMEIPVEVETHRFDDPKRSLIICMARETTQRRNAEKALLESRQQFADFFRLSPIGIAIYDGDRRLRAVNRSCMRMFGIPDQEQFTRFNPFDNPSMPSDARMRLQRGEDARYEAAIDFNPSSKGPGFITTRTTTAHFDIMVSGMGLDEGYRTRGWFVQIQDITERRVAEDHLRRNEVQLRQAEKMEAIGSMASGIAHDFNNILTPIMGYAQILMQRFSEKDFAYEPARRIFNAANRAKELVGQILTFSRKSEDQEVLHAVHIIPIAKEVLRLQSTALPPNVAINRVIKTENDIVMANPTLVHQVLMNLCTNAGYAMKERGGVLDLWINEVTVTRRSASDFDHVEPGRYVRISIRDTGTGIPPDVLPRIFEPFFTTKPSGEGTGMGLSVVHGIVKRLKGSITVETEVGKGSTFHILLPVVEHATPTGATATQGQIPRGTERILIVDDDRDVLETATDMLRSLGYDATTTNHANGALRLFELDPQHFDAVVTDFVMPGVDGIELTRRLMALRPSLPVVLCTGFGEPAAVERARAAGVRQIVAKPISLDLLASALRKAIDQVVT